MKNKNLLLFALTLSSLLVQISIANAVTFCVDGVADDPVNAADCDANCTDGSNNCSLRDAITAANGNANSPIVDMIIFQIPGPLGSVQTYQPSSVLPNIIEPVFIDGYTQSGASQNTLANGIDATLLIELDGTNAGPITNGLEVATGGGGSTIRGLVINNFGGTGILLSSSDNNFVEGNFLGTDPTGTIALGNQQGLVMALGSDVNTIGGSVPESRNLISGNDFMGMQIGGNGGTGNLIRGNFIGTDVSGLAPLGNGGNGILIFDSDNLIGGLGASGNRIAFNQSFGIAIVGPPTNTGDAILGNSIFSNGELGINLADSGDPPNGVTLNDFGDADIGQNNLQNFPNLTSAILSGGMVTIQGTLNSTATTNFRIEFFANNACDASGFGEGEIFLGSEDVTTDGGNVNLSSTFPAVGGSFITATATGPTGTSEFSNCIPITLPVELCTNGSDDDGDTQIDCQDSDCASDPSCLGITVEDCDNGLDDDGDGATDCDDLGCLADPSCLTANFEGGGCQLGGNARSGGFGFLFLGSFLAIAALRFIARFKPNSP